MFRTPRLFLISVLVLLVSGVAATTVPASAESDGTAAGITSDPATGFAGAGLPTDAWTLHVDVNASDDGVDGTAAHPFPSLEWAVAISTGLRQQGHAVRVVIAPGTYRETVNVGNAGANPLPLVIEPDVPGTVTVSGADLEDRWTPVEGRPGVVSAPWDLDWGLSPVPNWGELANPVADGARRREVVLVDGFRLAQVLSADGLTPGSFYVDEAGDQLLMAPPEHVTDVQDHDVEVARRAYTLRIEQNRDVTVRGITFETGAPSFEGHMAYVTDSAGILVEDSTFRHSSWSGLGFSRVAQITVRDSHFVDNGGNGVNTNSTTDTVIERNEISRNNVRGGANGWKGWSVAGSKNLRLTNAVFRDNVYIDNLARGLWLDTDIQGVLVDRERAYGNHKDGITIEAAQGPVTVRDGDYSDNWGPGIGFGVNSNVTVQGTTLADNGTSALYFEHDRERAFTDRVTGEAVVLRDFADLTLIDTTFISNGHDVMGYTPLVATRWISIADWRALLGDGEITASGNTWEHAPEVVPFWIAGDTSFTLEEWHALTDGSADPTEEDPEPTGPGKSGKTTKGGGSTDAGDTTGPGNNDGKGGKNK